MVRRLPNKSACSTRARALVQLSQDYSLHQADKQNDKIYGHHVTSESGARELAFRMWILNLCAINFTQIGALDSEIATSNTH